jgi:hypothetical protein
MSQTSLLNVITTYPQIPTAFITDIGTAIQAANILNVVGGSGIETSAHLTV